MSVTLDPANGVAILGNVRVAIRLSDASGALQIGDEQGPIVRPLTFIERTRLAGHAAASRTPLRAMAKLLADAALETPGTADEDWVAIIAMVLAGAGETDLPSFAESAMLLAQTVGWTLAQLGETDAVEVDRLVRLFVPNMDDGWTRLVLDDQRSDGTDSAIQDLRDRLAANLLGRLQPSGHVTQRLQAGEGGSEGRTTIPLDRHGSVMSTPVSSDDGVTAAASVRGRPSMGNLSTDRGLPREPASDIAPTQSGRLSGAGRHEAAGSMEGISDDADESNHDRALDPGAVPSTGPVHLRTNLGRRLDDAAGDLGASQDGDGMVLNAPIPVWNEASVSRSARVNTDVDQSVTSTSAYTPRPGFPSTVALDQPARLDDPRQPIAQHLTPNLSDGNAAQHSGTAPVALLSPAAESRIDLDEVIEELAARLHLEADLRGIDR